ncbi:DUF1622 domain-containing protein [Streptomyces goshikiensis]|nr:DUF1622 domain-containing protein [Streptomyces goshikiensis]
MRLALGPAGQLAAIAAIQTLLNFFLTREIAKERPRSTKIVKGPNLTSQLFDGPCGVDSGVERSRRGRRLSEVVDLA